LFWKVEFVMIGAEESPQEMPPPKGAKLLEMVQLSMNGFEEFAKIMPPPLPEASLLVMVELVMVGEAEDATEMPPPAEALLLVMMQLVMKGEASAPIRTPPPFPDVEPFLIVTPSRVASKFAAMVTTLPVPSPTIVVDSGPFNDLRVMLVLLVGPGPNRIFPE
jgi:hypothetical protein